jgi:hypothetical protein
MRVVQAQIQTAEEIYRLVWTAVENKQPIGRCIKGGSGCFAHIDWAGIAKDGFAYSAINTAESLSGLQPAGSPANWRCVALEKLSRVKLTDDAWHTAPNHSRPASCVAEADIDAEDHPERDPQKGQ